MTSLAAEVLALTSGTAIVDRSSRTRIVHHGKDALDLLHRLSTNDLLGLGEGEARGTIVTNGDGRIIDVMTVVKRPGAPLLLIASPGRAGALLEWIDRYTFEEDSRLEDVSDSTAQLTLIGPESNRMLAALFKDAALPRGQNQWVKADLGGTPSEVLALDYLGLSTLEVIVPSSAARGIRDALVDAGATIASPAAFDFLRVRLGVPEFDADLDEQNNPLEGGLASMVSFTKGCYVGQEVVARLDTYDKVQRRIVKVEADARLEYGADLMDGDRTVGAVKTVSAMPVRDRIEALALVRKGSWAPGTRLTTADGVHVNVTSTVDVGAPPAS
ncbi:MAG: folate-binding protein YgfZ [Chloroflexi bacterium]|nr:folate-binding protein YgfZ [Chloroflexota bacterium]